MSTATNPTGSALPASLAHRSFTSAEAAAAGLTWGRLQSRGVVSPSRGIWVPGHLVGSHYQARALSRLHPAGAISHLTAARIWGFPLPLHRATIEPVHLTLPPGTAATSRRGVVCHRLHFDPDRDVVELSAGTRVTSRLRTVADLSMILDVDDLVAVLDHLLRRPRPRLEKRPPRYERHPFAELDDLHDLLLARAGRRGAKALRQAVGLARVGSDSPRETQLRLACLPAGLPEPELNVPIEVLDDQGRLIARLHEPDLQWKQFRVAAEYEGLHHSDPRQIERDVGRADSIRDASWTEVRVVSSDMARDCVRAVTKIEKALRANGWRAD